MSAPATPELIVALDRPTLADALALIDALGDACRFYKVGLELFTAAGPAAVDALRDRGAEVFLDLKLHDIPATVSAAARRAAALGVRLLTVHASGGEAMVRAAVDGAATGGPRCGILAVTVLTSLDAAALAAAWGRDALNPEREVERLARVVADLGAYGVVCSGAEVAAVRATAPG
ncbi:MAG: orotidine-5'-phosphate decarboxylase, partial [Candidatus Eremiobacteraeota bacterium]|nr:orotidine-5'-phosphate decarboxylase [Candidatus Eremiobacteraeota bacterium]